jgi:CRP-like cAMP-binding protein
MAIEEDIVFLGRIATFRVLGRDAMRILAISAEPVHLSGGEQLFEEGEPADGGYILVNGAIEMKSIGDRLGGSVVALPGTLIGETAMIVVTMRPASAIALEASTLLRITRSVFLRTLEGEPEAAEALRNMMAGRLRSTLSDLDLAAPLFEPAPADEEGTPQEN